MHSAHTTFVGTPLPQHSLLSGQTWWGPHTWRDPSGNTVNDIHDPPQAQQSEVKVGCQPDFCPASKLGPDLTDTPPICMFSGGPGWGQWISKNAHNMWRGGCRPPFQYLPTFSGGCAPKSDIQCDCQLMATVHSTQETEEWYFYVSYGGQGHSVSYMCMFGSLRLRLRLLCSWMGNYPSGEVQFIDRKCYCLHIAGGTTCNFDANSYERVLFPLEFKYTTHSPSHIATVPFCINIHRQWCDAPSSPFNCTVCALS